MAFSEALADRVRAALADRDDLSEKRMFGGICFLLGGNMCCGVVGEDLMVRVGPDAYEDALGRPHAREMDFTGRPMRGMVYVDAAGIRTAPGLGAWVARGVAFAGALPPK